MTRRTLLLTAAEQAALEHSRDHETRPYLREQAAALLKVAAGQAASAVARHGLLKPRRPNTLYGWLNYYQEHRQLHVRPACRRGFSPEDAARQEVLAQVHQSPQHFGYARSRWSLHLLGSHCQALQSLKSLSGVWRRLRKWHIRRKRGRYHVTSPDEHYLAKLHLLAAAQTAAARGEVVLLYGDEHTFYRQPLLGSTYHEQDRGGRHRRGGRHQPQAQRWPAANTKRRTVATLEVNSGRVLHRSAAKAGVRLLCRFLHQVRRTYQEQYGPAVRLLLVWDNWPIHYHPQVLLAAQAAAIELLWLPSYAPWLNPIEKLWRKLQDEVLGLHRLSAQWEQLKGQVQAFLAGYARPHQPSCTTWA